MKIINTENKHIALFNTNKLRSSDYVCRFTTRLHYYNNDSRLSDYFDVQYIHNILYHWHCVKRFLYQNKFTILPIYVYIILYL